MNNSKISLPDVIQDVQGEENIAKTTQMVRDISMEEYCGVLYNGINQAISALQQSALHCTLHFGLRILIDTGYNGYNHTYTPRQVVMIIY